MYRRIFSILESFITCFVLTMMLAMLVIRLSGSYVSMCGYSIFRVGSASMEPDLSTGDVILVRTASPEELQAGMDITYISYTADSEPVFITHRLVADPEPTDEGWILLTSGISPGAGLDSPVRGENLVGTVVRKMHTLTFLYSVFGTRAGIFVVAACMIFIIAYELRRLIRASRHTSTSRCNTTSDHKHAHSA